MDYLERYHDWLEHAPLNAEEHAALAAMREDTDALKSACGAELACGTAGLRGREADASPTESRPPHGAGLGRLADRHRPAAKMRHRL